MGKNTEAKLRKVIGTSRFRKVKEDNEIKVSKQKPVQPKKVAKVVTEDSQSKKTTVFLIMLFIVIAGLGVYFKVFTHRKPKAEGKSITELFGTPPPRDDKMLEPKKLTKEELQKYVWLDSPVVLANEFEIISFFRAKFPKVRIEIKGEGFNDQEIPLRNVGDMLTDRYKIIDIQDPVVFLSDKAGKMHRLVDPKNWNIAASIYGWKKNMFGDPNEVKNDEPEGMTPEEAAITFGDFELVNASDSQVSLLRAWVNENPDYRFEAFERKCSELGVAYKLKLGSTMGGLLKPNASNGK